MYDDLPATGPDKDRTLDDASALISEAKRQSEVSQKLLERCRYFAGQEVSATYPAALRLSRGLLGRVF